MLSDGAAGGGVRAAGIDLNCDMGEGMETDAAIFPFVSSANIACGGHAGDADTMRRTVELALRHGVAIGAHPSYPDRGNFGRVDVLGVSLQPGELRSILQEQLDRLQGVCREFGTRMRHVKPHGALYNRAARDTAVAMLIVRAVAGFDDSLLLYGLSGGVMKDVADVAGIRFVSDFEYEKAIADMNRRLDDGIETVFLTCKPEYSTIASTLVRDVLRNGGDASPFLPEEVIKGLEKAVTSPTDSLQP